MDKPADIEAWLAELGQPSADRDYLPGHARMQQLLAGMPAFRPGLRIRIAGTNGKGSTANMLAAALQSAGLKVGLYTSPHILSFNERIRIHGEPVANEQLLEALARIMPLARAAGASYFETATALALDQFRKARVDVEILEAGVGARLDATTAVPADMALITPIGLDHQAWLGDDIESIALEKAHIMQGCRYCISAPQSKPVSTVLRDFHTDLQFCTAQSFEQLALAGTHQQINAALALAACTALHHEINETNGMGMTRMRSAIMQCRPAGRLQALSIGKARIWLDAAHNRHAIEALLPSLKTLADPFDAILVFTRDDRCLVSALPLLKPYTRKLISNADDHSQSAAQTLQALMATTPAGRFLVLGSFITVANILRTL